MKTRRLYYDDPTRVSCTARVIAHGDLAGYAAVGLDQSVFYPEGGGQPADRGWLNDLEVVDVQAEAGMVWHMLAPQADQSRLTIGQEVEAQIDMARRFDHMQQHCGQHLLSAALVETAGLATVGFHLSENSLTIDLDGDVSAEQIAVAESLANQIIWENRGIEARFVADDELAQLPLRKRPVVDGPVRIVSIAGFDHSACGGTHPSHTGAVGIVIVLRMSRQRNGTRIEFACGKRALQTYRWFSSAANTAATRLSIGIEELPAAIERLQSSHRAQTRALEQAHEHLDWLRAQELYTAGQAVGTARIVGVVLNDITPERLRFIARAIAEQPGGVAILGLRGERAQLVVACAADSNLDARSILQAGLAVTGGRGGGTHNMAQGGSPDSAVIEPALEAMLSVIQ